MSNKIFYRLDFNLYAKLSHIKQVKKVIIFKIKLDYFGLKQVKKTLNLFK